MKESIDNLPDQLDVVIEEFLGRFRAGEAPSTTEFELRYPDLAGRIRALFPTLLLLEGRPQSQETKCSLPSFTFTSLGESPTALLGPFRIVRELGRGGMGVVYEAVQEPLGRRVALKVLPSELALRRSYRERFGREASAASKLHHTNIVPVFSSGEHDGTLYFAMQFIDGRTIADLLTDLRAGGKVPNDHFTRAARLAMQAAEALACAHSHSVLHRDIKPANLLVDAEGTLWVADFGLAKASDTDELTGTGELVGTLRYLAPERFAGHCDTRSDIYALGATLYEMLALRPAFDETDRLRLVKQIANGAPSLQRVARAVPPDLETVVRKAMASDPAERYPTAQEMADDLRLFLADQPIKARRASSWERLRRWARHNPTLARMTMSIVVLLLVVAIGASVLSLELSGSLERTRAAERETQRKLLDALIAQAQAVHRGQRSGQRFECLKLLDQAAELARSLDLFEEKRAELRNVTIAALAMPDLYPIQSWDVIQPGAACVDFDERLEIYAHTDGHGNCHIYRVEGNVLIATLPHPNPSGREALPVFSRDGRFIAVLRQHGGNTQVWKLDEDRPRLLMERGHVYEIEFHPTLNQVAFADDDGHITLWELTDGEKLIADLPPDRVLQETNTALHPLEPLIAVASYFSKVVQIRDLRTKAVVRSLEMDGNGMHVAWHPAGHTLAASEGDAYRIHLFDRATFERQRTFNVHGGGSRLSYNRSGDRLAVSAWFGYAGLYDPATGNQIFQLRSTQLIPQLRFDLSGLRLAGFMQDRRLGIWEVGEGREYRIFSRSTKLPSMANGVKVSRDGRLVVAPMSDGLSFWDLDAGKEILFQPHEKVQFVEFEAGEVDALLIGDDSGVHRLPMSPDPQVPGRVRIGPPRSLGMPGGHSLGQSRDGRVLATALRPVDWSQPWAGAWVQHADHPDRLAHLDEGGDVRGVELSPDGRWLITVEANPNLVKLWDARTGRLERTLREQEQGGTVKFSPDGQWLAVGGTEACLLTVGSWEAKWKLKDWGQINRVQFSPDSRILVIPIDTVRMLYLIETATGRELARIEYPNLELEMNPTFAPDGSKLLLNSVQSIQVWDLRRIRAELAQRNLDWDLPLFRQHRTLAGG